jgi:hypothetical protein
VLIAGGVDSSGILDRTAEIYDPHSGTFALTNGHMAEPRSGHTATPLQDETVLITGGTANSPLAELFEPAAGAFTVAGQMNVTRQFHAAAMLEDGQVLLVGGGPSEPVFAELYDPASGAFLQKTIPAGGPFVGGQSFFFMTGTALGDGTMLTAGGVIGSLVTADAEIFEPPSDSFNVSAVMRAARHSHTATILVDGRVLISGGLDDASVFGKPVATAELYDRTTGAFTFTEEMDSPRGFHTATALL